MHIESEGREKHLSYKWKSQESQSTNTYIGKLYFKQKTVTGDEEEHYTIIRGQSNKNI